MGMDLKTLAVPGAIVDEKTENGEIFYKIKWSTYDDPSTATWESASSFDDVPQYEHLVASWHGAKRAFTKGSVRTTRIKSLHRDRRYLCLTDCCSSPFCMQAKQKDSLCRR